MLKGELEGFGPEAPPAQMLLQGQDRPGQNAPHPGDGVFVPGAAVKDRYGDKEIVPAALLYYRIDDPAVETPVELTEEEIEEEIGKQLRMNGVVNGTPGIVYSFLALL